jgi:hypothetical protein
VRPPEGFEDAETDCHSKTAIDDEMKKRLAFCRKYKHWTAADWEKENVFGHIDFQSH